MTNEKKQTGCEIIVRGETGEREPCNRPVRFIVTVGDEVYNCCATHVSAVTERAKSRKLRYKVEPIPPEP